MSDASRHIARELLERAHSPDTAATIFQEKVKHRPLVLRATSPDPGSNARARRQHQRLIKDRARRKSNKPKPLSAKRRRALNLNDVPKEHRKYSIYEPVHKLWCEYVREVLGLEGVSKQLDTQSVGPLLASADYHGAILEVVRSRCPGRVGLRGIVIKDTRFTFEIITMDDELKVVPKEHTIFRFAIPSAGTDSTTAKPYVFEILGSQFETRAADRATKKFRLHLDLDT